MSQKRRIDNTHRLFRAKNETDTLQVAPKCMGGDQNVSNILYVLRVRKKNQSNRASAACYNVASLSLSPDAFNAASNQGHPRGIGTLHLKKATMKAFFTVFC